MAGRIGEGFSDKKDFATEPVASAVRAASSKTAPERVYDGVTRMVKITNRGKKGPLAGKAFTATVGGLDFPDGCDRFDDSTWLQPGESMLVERESALILCGDVFSPTNRALDANAVIRYYGDWQWRSPGPNPDDLVQGRNVPMIKAGPPPYFPDLLIQQVDGRGRPVGEEYAIYDLYVEPEEKNFKPWKQPAHV